MSAFRSILLCLLPTLLPAATDEASLRAEADDPAARSALAANELRRVAAPVVGEFSRGGETKRFLDELNASPVLLSELMGSGPLPDDPGKMLRVLFELWKHDRAGLADEHERGTAVAVALTFGDSKWPTEKAVARYDYFRDSRRDGLLHPMFDDLAAWEKRYVVSAGGNGSWNGPGGWDDASLVWLRDHVKLPAPAYTGACWQAPYHLHNLFGDSIHGSAYYMPFEHMVHAERVRDVGGVCGSLSHYGATAARANGIPAITMGEPGHCAYAVRVKRGAWTPAYSLSWQRGLHTSLWGRTWTQLVLQDAALTDAEAHARSTAHLWQARALREKNPDLAETAYRLALEAQPLHQPAWLEATAFLRDVRKPDAAAWTAIQKAALAALAEYPEAAWDVVSSFQKEALAALPAEQRLAYLLAFHEAIAPHDGPVMWNIDAALKSQAQALGGDFDQQIAFFQEVLKRQVSSKSWLAPVVAWGQQSIGSNPASSDRYFVALSTAFSSANGGDNQDALRSAIGKAVLAAAAIRNVEAFQALGKSGAPLREGAKPIQTEPFSGELLTSGGLLVISTTSRWDHPEYHWGVLEACGGKFHTDAEVRPHAIVRLGKLGDLTGVVIHDEASGYNASRQLPLKVSISEDGESWTEVFRTTEHQPMWRIPLEGKAPRVQFLKVERDDDRKEVFHLNAIHAYGRRLQ
ncbi:MAG: hypothetical protein H7A48_07545 [Akkermansiaceae bacterium]|nr:hypothetical protein [Akkermansiaceae bacterium]